MTVPRCCLSCRAVHCRTWRMLRASSETASVARDFRVERKIFPDVCISCFVVLVFDISLADCRTLLPLCVCSVYLSLYIHPNSKWMSMSMQSHKSSTRSGKGQRKPPSITKADEPTRSRQLQEPTNSRKKCLANPQRESALTKQDMIGTQSSIDQLHVAATTDRTPQQATAKTHQDARNHGATTQSSKPERKVNHTRSFPWTTTFGDARDAVPAFSSRHI